MQVRGAGPLTFKNQNEDHPASSGMAVMLKKLNNEQKVFIKKLRAATNKIPKGVGLFCSESGLHVMQLDENGGYIYTEYQGIDSEYVIDTVTIDCLGGAW